MSRRALIVALVVSVAMNLFLVGVIAGALRFAGPMHGPGLRPPGPLWAAADGLSPERRRAYRQALRGEVGGVGGKLFEARRARRAAWLSLSAEGFDPAAVAAALQRARTLEFAARGDVEGRVVAFAATLTPAERAILAKGLARARPGRRPGLGPPPESRRDPDPDRHSVDRPLDDRPPAPP